MSKSSSNEGQVRQPTTAAKRMMMLLTKVRDQPGPNLGTIVPIVLDLKSIDTGYAGWDAMRSQALIAEMIKDVHREIDEASLTDDQKSVYIRDLVGVMNALSPLGYAIQAPQSKAAINETLIMRFEYLDLALRNQVSEKELQGEEISALLVVVEEAIVAVKASQLPPRLRDFAVKQLLSVKSAIEQYKFRGIAGIEDALAAYCGVIAASGSQFDEKLSTEAKSKLKRVVETGQTLINLAHSAAWLLPHIAHGTESVVKFLGVLTGI